MAGKGFWREMLLTWSVANVLYGQWRLENRGSTGSTGWYGCPPGCLSNNNFWLDSQLLYGCQVDAWSCSPVSPQARCRQLLRSEMMSSSIFIRAINKPKCKHYKNYLYCIPLLTINWCCREGFSRVKNWGRFVRAVAAQCAGMEFKFYLWQTRITTLLRIERRPHDVRAEHSDPSATGSSS